MKKKRYHMSLFLFILHFIGAIPPKRMLSKVGGLEKRYKEGHSHIGVVIYRRGRGSNFLQAML